MFTKKTKTWMQIQEIILEVKPTFPSLHYQINPSFFLQLCAESYKRLPSSTSRHRDPSYKPEIGVETRKELHSLEKFQT
ncbi:hypothetical protein L1887_10987 [Cichorium endivia]|nr:hypothetical protein L1887_10987 [Cichorium endivia]